MSYMKIWRDLWTTSDLAQKRIENLSAVITQINTQFIPKIHDRLAASERHVKKFDPMLERWENGYLVRTRVVRQRVEVPVGDSEAAKTEHAIRGRRTRKEADYGTYMKVVQMLNDGLTAYRIGKELGISHQMVANYRNMSPERVEHLRLVSEGKVALYDNRVRGMARPLTNDEVQKVLDIQATMPDIPLSRLSVLTGVSVYRLKKYMALKGNE
ncbi:hypothetical protein JHX32_19195 [Escherichia coli]|uniref:hypothetical protein n=1 Tax=Escherichia coli TaxID=562 RepID=UPI001BD4DF35|nr:hypothetical protein [Escherichia coli]MBS9709494.1 hypothetical protein [Escherichia coli]HAV9614151.1 hypothetical protein [Escherichia coli]